MKILAMLYVIAFPGAQPEPVAAYFTQEGIAICQATAVAQNAIERKEYFCE